MKLKSLACLAVLSFVFAGCGGDDSSSSGSLNEAQSNAVASSINNAVKSALVSVGVPAFKKDARNANALIGPRGLTSSVEYSAPCAAGGTAAVTGTTELNNTGSGSNYNYTVDYDYEVTFDECQSTGSDSKTYTIDGSITSNGEGTFVASNNGQTIDMDYSVASNGNISVTGEGVNVSNCAISTTSTVMVEGTSPNFSGSSTYSGTICGTTVNNSFTF